MYKIHGLAQSSNTSMINICVFPIIPVQILDVLLTLLLKLKVGSPNLKAQPNLPPIYDVIGVTELPLIDSKLPHCWYQHVAESDSAVKSDSADIDLRLWDLRIMLVYSKINSTHIQFMQKNLMTTLYHKFYTEFKEYPQQKFPSKWKSFIY